MSKVFCLHTIKWKNFYFKQFSWVLLHSLNVKTVLFQTIRFSMHTQFSSIWPIHMTQSDAPTPGQCEPGSNGNEEVFHARQNSSITEASPSDFLVSYQGHSLEESNISAEIQSAYSATPANWEIQG